MIKKIISIIVIVAILFGFFKLLSQKPSSVINNNSALQNDLVLFYGSTCPHCKVVEEFIKTNKIDEKLKIGQLEVYENKDNAKTMASIVQKVCPDQLTEQGIAVPFLVDTKNNQCIVGDTPINDYLTNQVK